MGKLLNYLLSQTRKYTLLDWAFLKQTLLSAGILLGSYFTAFFQVWIVGLWLIFAVSYFWTIWATFRKR